MAITLVAVTFFTAVGVFLLTTILVDTAPTNVSEVLVLAATPSVVAQSVVGVLVLVATPASNMEDLGHSCVFCRYLG